MSEDTNIVPFHQPGSVLDPLTVNRHANLTLFRRPNLTPPMRRRDQGLSRRNFQVVEAGQALISRAACGQARFLKRQLSFPVSTISQ